MKIEKNKVVVLTYELTVDGNIADCATVEKPLDYIHGTHMLLPAFEDAVEGKSEGEGFSFTLGPAEGYGEYDPSLRFDIPKESFSHDGKIMEELLVPGHVIPMLNQDGMVCHATIIEIKDSSVTVDFNHQMAGKTLVFTGEILSVREAMPKELLEGLHGEYLPKGGCCCGGGHHHHHKGGCDHDGEGGCCHGKGNCHEDGEECHCHEDGEECHCHEDGGGCHCHEEN